MSAYPNPRGPGGFHMFGALAEFELRPDPGAHPSGPCRRAAQAAPEAVRRNSRTTTSRPAKALLANPDIGVTQIAHRLGVSPATLYRYIPAARTANTPGV